MSYSGKATETTACYRVLNCSVRVVLQYNLLPAKLVQIGVEL